MSAPQLRQFEEEADVPDQPESADRRQSPRIPAREIGEILTENGRGAISCMVRNLSGTGAMLETGTSDLPSLFVLVNHVRRLRTVCRVVWRRGNHLGVRFLTNPRSFG